MSRRAVILAGGRGTRLRPYTVVLPKPLMPIGEYPILEIVIRQLSAQGFDRITLAVNHQAEIIMAFFGNGSRWGIKIDYSLEEKPLSTMGPLKLIHDLPENFLVMNGDVLTDIRFDDLFDYHCSHGNIFTISAHTREQISEYGILEVNSDGRLIGFKEKPSMTFQVSMGVYVANRRILEIIPSNTLYGFDHLMMDLIQRGIPPSVKPFLGYWLDIGRPDDYQEAVEVFEKDASVFIGKEG